MAVFKDHFSEGAAEYAAFRPDYPVELADLLAQTAPRREMAWDCGCGSGQLSVLLGDRFEQVIGTDASAEQLAHAVPHPSVEYRCSPAESCGLADGTADLAVSAQAAHWFNLEAYYSEIRRVARRGGIVALVTYCRMEIDEPIDALVDHFYSKVVGPYWPPERRHVEAGYRSLPFPFEEIEAPTLEMRADWTRAGVFGYVETWSAVQKMAKAEGRVRIDAFRHEVAKVWGPPESIRPIRWPLSVRVGRN